MDKYHVLCVLRQQNGSKIERVHHDPIGPFSFITVNSRRLLHHNLSHHLGVNTAVIQVGSGLDEGERILVVCVERLRLEQTVITSDNVWYIIFVYPGYGAVDGNSQRFRSEVEVINPHFYSG